MGLGPLQVEKREMSAPLQPIPAGEPGRPGQQLPSTIFLPRDAAGEAQAAEARTRESWRKNCPEVEDAFEACETARVHHHECSQKWQHATEALMQAQRSLNSCGPDSPLGSREDRKSDVAIRSGFEQVARFNLNAAADALREAKNNLAAANEQQSRRAEEARKHERR